MRLTLKRSQTNHDVATGVNFQAKYNDFKQTLEELQSKLIELGHDKDEHDVVLTTLNEASPTRKCYRMVGGALVESDVESTIPILSLKQTKLTQTISELRTELSRVAVEFEKWKKDNKIQVVKQ